MSYRVKFRSSASKGVRINIKELPKLGALGHHPIAVGVWLTPLKYAPPQLCYTAEFGRSRSNGNIVIIEIRLKNLNFRILHLTMLTGPPIFSCV